ncbi:MAG: IS66 family insertion sequence element accessory protein TnpB [Gemmatimonadota bacterium]|nr:IS66 family insertion sequence element accessory protein TnpB [Gemmatimonadota bacterium]
MSTGKPRDPRKERFWRRMLRQWDRSGLSARDFCQQRRLSQASLYAWRRTLADRDRHAVHFLPVEVLPQTEPVDSPRDSAVAGLELMLNGGRVLRIGPAFDGPTLQRLLTLLEEGQP